MNAILIALASISVLNNSAQAGIKENRKNFGSCDRICATEVNNLSADTDQIRDLRGQLDKQCVAYQAANEARPWMAANLALDVTAFAACTGACVAYGTPAYVGFGPACMAAGVAASGSEVAALFAMKQSKVSKVVNGIGAVAGLGAATGTITSAALLSKKAGNIRGFNPMKKGTKISEGAAQKAHQAAGKSGKSASKAQRAMACVSAATFGVLAGLRTANIVKSNQTKKSACQKVMSLSSGINQQTLDQSQETSLADSSQPQTVGEESLPLSGTSAYEIECDSGNNCNLDQLGSVESDFIINSGLDKKIGPEAAKVSPKKLLEHIDNGGSIGELLDRTDSTESELGNDIAALAQDIQENPNAYMGDVPDTVLAGRGGGGGSAGSSEGSDNPGLNLKSLFGGDKKEAKRGLAKVDRYGRESKNTDIWHRNSDQSIFEIVSGAYGKAETQNRL